jgi:uncharacterized protein (DUF433 family)
MNPSVCHGRPVIRGTRVLVSTILGAMASGDSIEDVLADYPNLRKEDIEGALEFASRLSDFQTAEYEVVV